MRTVLILVGSLSVFGCKSPVAACTANYVYGLAIYVSDRTTQVSLVNDQTRVVVREGTFVDTAVAFNGVFNAAGERPGLYTVTVERAGYHSATQSHVRVSAGECHVRTVGLHIRLDVLP
jgi:hypothetical protein